MSKIKIHSQLWIRLHGKVVFHTSTGTASAIVNKKTGDNPVYVSNMLGSIAGKKFTYEQYVDRNKSYVSVKESDYLIPVWVIKRGLK